jgi:ABC-type transport system involved in multi-copper enzyme maturation permease subunit
MRKIWLIGLNTFREAIRNKILYSLLFFSLLIIAASVAFGELSVGSQRRLTMDLGLGGMSLFSIIIAVFVGINLVYKELEHKTIFTLLSKPVFRYQFVLGKFLGLALTMAVLVLIMSLVLVGVLLSQGHDVGQTLAIMVVLIYLEVLLITAVAVFFSSFSSPFLSGAFTIGIFIVGRNLPEIEAIAAKMKSMFFPSALALTAKVLPNLRFFYVTGSSVEDVGQVSVSGVFVDWSYVGQAAAYGGLYIAVVLLLAMFLFSRRDFV